MKTRTKICLIAAMLCVGGIILFFIGMSTLGWNFTRLDCTRYTAKSYALEKTEAVDRVEVSVSSFPIDIVNGDSLKLEYYEASNSVVTVERVGGTVKIIEEYKYNPFVSGLFSLGRSSHRFVLTVPTGIKQINAYGANCGISVQGLELDILRMEVTNLDLDLKSVNVDAIDISSTNTAVSFDSVTTYDLALTSVNLDMDMTSCSVDTASVHATNIDMDATRSDFVSMKVSGTNLDVDCIRVDTKSFDMDGTNVGFSSEMLAVDKLTVKGVNLDADIEINGAKQDYSIVTDGKNLPNEQQGTTDKSITLKGTNNSVDLKFVI